MLWHLLISIKYLLCLVQNVCKNLHLPWNGTATRHWKGSVRIVACFVVCQPTGNVVALYEAAIHNSLHNARRNKRCAGESAFLDTNEHKGRERRRVSRRVQCVKVIKVVLPLMLSSHKYSLKMQYKQFGHYYVENTIFIYLKDSLLTFRAQVNPS